MLRGGEKVRKTGIGIIGNASWKTPLCQFYETKEGLIDILAPYFKVGSENNEFCICFFSEFLHVEDAKRALKQKVKYLDSYVENGRIEILDCRQWCTRSGHSYSEQVLEGWIEKEQHALEKGFSGLHLIGNSFRLEKKDCESFNSNKSAMNSVISKYQMPAVYNYSPDKGAPSEKINMVSNRQFALLKLQDDREIGESAGHRETIEVRGLRYEKTEP